MVAGGVDWNAADSRSRASVDAFDFLRGLLSRMRASGCELFSSVIQSTAVCGDCASDVRLEGGGATEPLVVTLDITNGKHPLKSLCDASASGFGVTWIVDYECTHCSSAVRARVCERARAGGATV
jgi:hypothetical protein